MSELATISSKRQLTIPATIFKQAKLKEGQRVLVSLEKGDLKITPAVNLVEELAGSIEVPQRFKKLSIKQMIQKAKKEHFGHK